MIKDLGDRESCLVCGSEILDIVSYGGEYIEVTCRVCGDEDIDLTKIKYFEKLQEDN